MPQHLDTDVEAAWANPGVVDPFFYYDPIYGGSAIYTSNAENNMTDRVSLGDASSIISFRVRARGTSVASVGLVGSTPVGAPAFGYSFNFGSGIFAINGAVWGQDPSSLASSYPSVSYGLWTSNSIFSQSFTSYDDLAARELIWRIDAFFKKGASQSAMVYTREDQRYVSGFASVSGSIADWGAYRIFMLGRGLNPSSSPGFNQDPDACRIDQIRIQYNLTDEEVDASYNATIGGGTIGSGGVVIGGPVGEDGLPGRPGGIPGVTLLSGSQILPEATAKISHLRIMRGERTPSQAKSFHDFLRAKG